MKIVIVASDLFIGGSQRYLSSLANYWQSCGHDITLIVLRSGRIYYDLNEDINVVKLSYDHLDKFLRPFLSLYTWFQLRINLNRIKPDFVLSNLGTTNILTLLSNIRLGYKVFIRDAFGPTRRKGLLERFLRKQMYPRSAGIIAQSNEIKKNLLTEFQDARVEVIGNPVRKMKNTKHLKHEKIVLNVAALIKRKGQKYILDLAQSDSDKNWKYVILGEGPMREELEREICKRNLQDRFVLPGSVSNIDDWLFRASIFVFPSRLEGLPNALIEAMRAGLPCVSFDCHSGPSELIIDGINGYLVEVDDIESLIEVTNKLKKNESLRQKIGLNAANSVERFNIEEISSQLLSFFTEEKGNSQIANRNSQINNVKILTK